MKAYFVYIMTNPRNTVLYTGVTSWLEARAHDHRAKLIEGFTKRYNVIKLVFALEFSTAPAAIKAEKRIKGWARKKKISLINSVNPTWKDLADKEGWVDLEILRSLSGEQLSDKAQDDGLLGKLKILDQNE